MPATDALFMQQNLAEGTLTDAFVRFADGYVKLLLDGDQYVPPERGIDPDLTGTALARELRAAARAAHAFYVSPDMQVVVTAAAESFPQDAEVSAEDFPTQQGFMWVPEGVVTVDLRGEPCVTRAFLWSVHAGVAHIHLIADKEHPLDMVGDAPSARALPRLTPWHQGNIELGEPLPLALSGTRTVPPEVARHTRLTYVAGRPVLEGGLGDAQPTVQPDPTLRWLVTALRVMSEPLAAVRQQKAPKRLRDQLLRGRVRLKDASITVVEFRRREHDFGAEGKGREFTHRFLRRGHWRRQPVKDADGNWTHKVIWILPTIVGPADKPLVVRDHVNALLR